LAAIEEAFVRLDDAFNKIKNLALEQRKPLMAKSKRLLEERGIATASIPATILDRPEEILALLSKADRVSECIRRAALDAIGRALTQGTEEAEVTIEEYLAASLDIDSLDDSPEWILMLVGERIVAKPGDGKAVAGLARGVIDLALSVGQTGVVLAPYSSLEDASASLGALNGRIQEYDRFLASEELLERDLSLARLTVEDASNRLIQALNTLRDEKARLIREVASIQSQLATIGAENHEMASTLNGWRTLVPRLRQLLNKTRSALRRSLGAPTFRVVESLLEGKLPDADKVADGELGMGSRKAVECGYRISLEPPHEN
jgi:hypothetical protein